MQSGALTAPVQTLTTSIKKIGAEAMHTADCARQAIQVSLHAIEHAAGIALKVHANLELARCDKVLTSLSFDSDTKAQLCTLPLAHEELFGGKLGNASKQAEEQGYRQCELRVAFKVPQAQSRATFASAPTYSFQTSVQHSSQLGRGWDKGKSKKGRGCWHGLIAILRHCHI